MRKEKEINDEFKLFEFDDRKHYPKYKAHKLDKDLGKDLLKTSIYVGTGLVFLGLGLKALDSLNN